MTHAVRDGAARRDSASVADMTLATTPALAAIHRSQTHRAPWPDWPAHLDHLPATLRRDAAVQWAARARNEHRSVHQFAALTSAATRARLPLEILGGLARLVTDEVRHAEVCARMALLCEPEARPTEPEIFRWPAPVTGWDPEPDDDDDRMAWMAFAVLEACCFGESLSVPMLRAISTVATEPVARVASDQILRDEHLHARFGWDTLGLLWPRLRARDRATLETRLPALMRGFERSCCQHITLAEVAAAPSVTVEPGDPEVPNLGTLTALHYAVIFYATIESDILPELTRLGVDALAAWHSRLEPPPG